MKNLEKWKNVKGYEELYEVSNLGKVKRKKHKRLDRNQILQEREVKVIYPKNKRYAYLSLCKNGKVTQKTLHRIIAEAFIPNPHNYPCINHIDGNKQNNNIDNLEWCTYSHNNKEAYRLQLKSTRIKKKKVNQYDLCGNFIKTWDSCKETIKQKYYHVTDVCKGKRKTAGGYIWKYVEEEK